MASQMVTCAFAVVLLLVMGISTSDAVGLPDVNPMCRTATHKRLCNRMVNGATTLEGASINAVKAALAAGRRAQAKLGMLQPAISTMDSTSQDAVMGTCVEGFDRLVDDLQTSLEGLQSNDKGTAVTHLSAALSNDCDDALSEFHVNSPLAKYTTILNRQVENCLAVVLADCMSLLYFSIIFPHPLWLSCQQ